VEKRLTGHIHKIFSFFSIHGQIFQEADKRKPCICAGLPTPGSSGKVGAWFTFMITLFTIEYGVAKAVDSVITTSAKGMETLRAEIRGAWRQKKSYDCFKRKHRQIALLIKRRIYNRGWCKRVFQYLLLTG
jgi:hypothetical protein